MFALDNQMVISDNQRDKMTIWLSRANIKIWSILNCSKVVRDIFLKFSPFFYHMYHIFRYFFGIGFCIDFGIDFERLGDPFRDPGPPSDAKLDPSGAPNRPSGAKMPPISQRWYRLGVVLERTCFQYRPLTLPGTIFNGF